MGDQCKVEQTEQLLVPVTQCISGSAFCRRTLHAQVIQLATQGTHAVTLHPSSRNEKKCQRASRSIDPRKKTPCNIYHCRALLPAHRTFPSGEYSLFVLRSAVRQIYFR